MNIHNSFIFIATIVFAPFVSSCAADAEDPMPTVGIIGTGDKDCPGTQ